MSGDSDDHLRKIMKEILELRGGYLPSMITDFDGDEVNIFHSEGCSNSNQSSTHEIKQKYRPKQGKKKKF